MISMDMKKKNVLRNLLENSSVPQPVLSKYRKLDKSRDNLILCYKNIMTKSNK